MNEIEIKEEVSKMIEALNAIFHFNVLSQKLEISVSMLYALKNRKYNHIVSAETYLKIKELYNDYCKKQLSLQ